MNINPIETRYAGCRFRSRLEARWAVFFDTLGIAWQYEPEGFEICLRVGGCPGPVDCSQEDHARYLPDFFLPATRTWVEVKGEREGLNRYRFVEALDFGGQIPYVSESLGTARGLLLLGPLPDVRKCWPEHPILQHSEGVWLERACFKADGSLVTTAWGDTFVTPETLVPLTFSDCPPANYLGFPREALPALDAYRAARSARFEHGESG